MAQRAAGKRRFSAAEVAELLTRRESDISASEVSDSTDEPTSEDDSFVDGDEQETSDHDWHPTKKTVVEASSSDEEDLMSVRARARRNRRRRGRARCQGTTRGRGTGRSRSSTMGESTSTPDADRWHGVEELDITPPQPTFCPSRTPGPQLMMTAAYSALDLFQLFFTADVLHTLLANSNEHGRAHCQTSWTDITMQDMFGFLSIVIYMGFVKCTSLTDYWRGGKLYNLQFPKSVISERKWLRILNALHLSSAAEDSANEGKRGTPEFDRLGKIKPLYMQMRDACRRNYHPRQHIAVDERMVASKARVMFKQYMKGKSVRRGFKLFVLADSSDGYTWDFFVYECKADNNSGKGLSYDVVTKLTNTSLLGTGYKVFTDYTSPTLFQDTRDVFLCSTIHTAHSSDTVTRKVKDSSGHWTKKDIPVPPVIKEYNQCMGGVDVSDALIGYYQVLHKTCKWYKTFFYHFFDIAVVNAFVLHKELFTAKGQAPMCQKAFQETLADQLMQLCTQGSVTGLALPRPLQPEPSQPSGAQHMLQFISGDKTAGRLKCRVCGMKTAVQCSTCNKPLCFVPNRNCYNRWHTENSVRGAGQ